MLYYIITFKNEIETKSYYDSYFFNRYNREKLIEILG